jgi:hypothetical protein
MTTTIRADALLRAQASLTPRDLTLLDWLCDYKLLTTPQIATALFASQDFAQRRLRRLVALGVLDRFRPPRADGGSFPYHYLLGQLGHEVIAGQRQHKLPRRDQARTLRAHLTSRANLAHRLAVNQFFTDLAGHTRRHPNTALEWPSPEPYHTPGGFVHNQGPDGDSMRIALWRNAPRPDGWGYWREENREIAFFAEIDLGTETLDVLAAKVIGYHAVAAYTTWRWPILFVLPTLRREHNLHTHLHHREIFGAAPIATTAHDHQTTTGLGPAEAVWQLHGHHGPRLRLIHLPHTDTATDAFDPTTPA